MIFVILQYKNNNSQLVSLTKGRNHCTINLITKMCRGGKPACAVCCMFKNRNVIERMYRIMRQTRNEVIDQSADASRSAVDRKLDTKPCGNAGGKVSVAEKAIKI